MCNYVYKDETEEEWNCTYQNYFDVNLPIDINGNCIFHSSNLIWKKENNFYDFLIQLFYNQKDDAKPLEFYDVHFIGISSELLDYDSDDDIILFTREIVKNDIFIYNCKFYDEIDLHNVVFKSLDFRIMNSTFYKKVNLYSCRFLSNDIFISENEFHENVDFFDDNYFKNNGTEAFNWIYNFHDGDLRLDGCHFKTDFIILECSNLSEKSENSYIFTNNFFSGIEFSNNAGFIMEMNNNSFHNNSLLYNLSKDLGFKFSNNSIFSEIQIKGTENNYQFTSELDINISKSDFKSSNAIIHFEFCNLFYDTAFVEQVEELKIRNLITIENSKLKKHSFYFEQPLNSSTNYLIEDYSKFVQRYFENNKNKKIDLSFSKIYKEDEQEYWKRISFFSNDNLDETFINDLELIFYEVAKETNQDNLSKEDKYLQDSVSFLLQQISNELRNKNIPPEDVVNILTLGTRLFLNEQQETSINSLININMKLNKSQVSIGNNNNQKYLNQPIVSEDLKKDSKEELIMSGLEKEVLLEAMTKLDELIEKVENDKPINKNKYLEYFHSIGSFSSIISFISQLN